ncbi:MAG: ATP-binding cassette domain-containing protein [Bacteroidota bacterium]
MPKPAQPKTLPSRLAKGIEFDSVSFAYPSGNGSAVKDLNLHIRDGELIALVGENGVGKSTIIKLLLRFYDVDSGSIRVGRCGCKRPGP